MKKISSKKLIVITITFLILSLIFMLSNQTGSVSNKMTLSLAKAMKGTVFSNYKGDYIRLEKKGNKISMLYSGDGVKWRQIEPIKTMKMKDTVYIGLMLSSHEPGKESTAIFDSVQVKSSDLEQNAWSNTDISKSGLNGKGKCEEEEYILTSGGFNEWERSGEYHFMYQKVSGDCSITARLKSVEETNYWALAGVAIRDNLIPGGNFSALVITPRGFISPQIKDDNSSEIYMKWGETELYSNNILVRKTLHFCGYLTLAVFLYMIFGGFMNKRRFGILIIVLFCFVLAAADEFHQSFIPGRDAKFTDVLIDTSGALLGVIIIYLITRIRARGKKVEA